MGIFNIRFPFQCRKEAIIETNKILKKFKYPLDEVRSIDETMKRNRKMELTKHEAIDILEKLLSHMMLYRGGIKPSEQEKEALNYAISSLKTDEAYQIMYEGGEIFTKADMIVMLKDLQSEIEKMQSVPCDYHGNWCIDRDKVCGIIQQKIDEL